jgi:predicted O-methyltransferase YrrM
MNPLLLLSHATLAGAAAVLGHQLVRYRRRAHRAEGKEMGWPIPVAPLEQLHPRFRMDAIGPTPQSEVRFIGGAMPGNTTDAEAWVLSVLARDALLIFEFGTFTGKTAYLLARNSPAEARVVTLAPEQHGLYAASTEDGAVARSAALEESQTSSFFRYSGTPAEAKITQLYGDSKQLDETPYLASCDLVFVDGSHAYSYVKSDSEKALRMLRPGGMVFWHDYRADLEHVRGVFRYLNELHRQLPLVRVPGTSLVAYRAPGGVGGMTATAR